MKKNNIGKKIMVIFAVLLIVLSTGCIRRKSSAQNEYKEIKWDYIILKDHLPKPKGTKGRIVSNSDNDLTMYVKAESSDPEDDYREYISACKENGYTINQENGTKYFNAENSDGYMIRLNLFDSSKEYSISLSMKDDDDEEEEEEKDKEEEKEEKEEEKKEDKKEEKKTSTGIRKEFKDAMDSYEKCMNEYVEFMKKYKANPSNTTLLSQYSKYLQSYSDAVEKFNKWNTKDLNNEELKYYMDVQNRVNKKLLEV